MTYALKPLAAAAADMSPIPAADLALLLRAIDQRRTAGLCGHHQRGSQPGCDAVAVWATGFGPGGATRPAALFCRDRLGRYRSFRGDGILMAAGSIADLIRLWK